MVALNHHFGFFKPLWVWADAHLKIAETAKGVTIILTTHNGFRHAFTLSNTTPNIDDNIDSYTFIDNCALFIDNT